MIAKAFGSSASTTANGGNVLCQRLADLSEGFGGARLGVAQAAQLFRRQGLID